MIPLAGASVLVTGATGFIGGRLVEKLMLEQGARVRVLLRNFARAPRIARFPIEMMAGDLTDGAAVRRAADGCDLVVHCAFGASGTLAERRAATIQGTETVVRACLDAGVKRLVHLSTVSVYGLPPDGDFDERTPPRLQRGDEYAAMKREAEQRVLASYERSRLPVAVLQPTIVYGPYSMPWTVMPLAVLKQERLVLVDGGSGLCNAVYVDDVVDAIVLAASRDEAVGQTFLISGGQPVTWRQFYGAYEQMLGGTATVPLSAAEIRALRREQRRARGTIRQVVRVLRNNPQLRARLLDLPAVGTPYRAIERATPAFVRSAIGRLSAPPHAVGEPVRRRERPMRLPDDVQVRFLQARARARTDKARRLLRYEPQVSFEEGMRITRDWAAWANLL